MENVSLTDKINTLLSKGYSVSDVSKITGASTLIVSHVRDRDEGRRINQEIKRKGFKS